MAKRLSKQLLRRFNIVRIGFIILFALVTVKIFYIQVIKHEYYESKAISQQTKDTEIAPRRGSILDRNGNELAISASAFKIIINPANIKKEEDAISISQTLSQILNLEYDNVYALTQKKLQYIEVKRRVEEDVVLSVNNYLLENPKYKEMISIAEDPKRYYPHGSLLSSVLGFTGTDGIGLEGLEMMYDSYLKGTPGKVIVAKNSQGTAMPFEYEKYIEAEDGNDITTTIDIEMQYFLEKHIDNARVEHNVENRVAGMIMNVKTGEILAMTSKPDFDPNDPFTIFDSIVLDYLAKENEVGSDEYWIAYNAMVKDLWKNKICEQYEPGSTFKILTSAMALEEGLVSLTETFNCVGSLKIASETIHCHLRTGHGIEIFKDGLANSCNPVFITLGARIGVEKFYNYLTIFGLRDKTNAGVPGEQTGYHYKLANYGVVDLATSAFGQGFKITPLQLMAAVCSVANSGNYMQPYIIKTITDKNGNIVLSNSPEVVKQTVSEETSKILKEYLEYTVVKGKKAYLEGYKIAGKTGTSQKLDSKNEFGEIDKKIASFIGFAPADDPQICVIVVVDEPNSEVQYGSYIAAPLAKDIIQDAMIHLNVEPDYGEGEGISYVKVPLLKGLDTKEASSLVVKTGLVAKIIGGEGTVNYQIPGDAKQLPKGSTILLYTNDEKPSYTVSVPDVKGLTAAESNRLLLNSDLNIRIKGSNISSPGVVAVSQNPAAGSTVDRATVVTVEFGKIE